MTLNEYNTDHCSKVIDDDAHIIEALTDECLFKKDIAVTVFSVISLIAAANMQTIGDEGATYQYEG